MSNYLPSIRTHAQTTAYRDGWDGIFGGKDTAYTPPERSTKFAKKLKRAIVAGCSKEDVCKLMGHIVPESGCGQYECKRCGKQFEGM